MVGFGTAVAVGSGLNVGAGDALGDGMNVGNGDALGAGMKVGNGDALGAGDASSQLALPLNLTTYSSQQRLFPLPSFRTCC